MSSLDRQSWSLNNPDFTGWDFTENVLKEANLVWDTGTLAWVKMTQPGGGGGGSNAAAGATGSAVPSSAGYTGFSVAGVLTGVSNATPFPVTSGFSVAGYDYVGVSSTTTTDVYVFKSGGVLGALLNTITIYYTDTTKSVIASVVKT